MVLVAQVRQRPLTSARSGALTAIAVAEPLAEGRRESPRPPARHGRAGAALRTSSAAPPGAEATSAVPRISASAPALPNGSTQRPGIAWTHAPASLRSSAWVSRAPASSTRAATPSSRASASIRGRRTVTRDQQASIRGELGERAQQDVRSLLHHQPPGVGDRRRASERRPGGPLGDAVAHDSGDLQAGVGKPGTGRLAQRDDPGEGPEPAAHERELRHRRPPGARRDAALAQAPHARPVVAVAPVRRHQRAARADHRVPRDMQMLGTRRSSGRINGESCVRNRRT